MKKGLCYTVSANTQIGRDQMTIITEDMRFSKRLCEFAQKHGVINAARRYKLTECLFTDNLQDLMGV